MPDAYDAPAFARGPAVTEISFELPADEVAVLDGYRQAHGESRTTVLRQILREWSEQRHREAVSICRVAGNNPTTPGTDRHRSGSANS